jgi:hypothetical protein
MVDEPASKHEQAQANQGAAASSTISNKIPTTDETNEGSPPNPICERLIVRCVLTRIWIIFSDSSFWIAAATVVIAAFTIVLACVSQRQWTELKRSDDNAERFFELSETPYVFVKDLELNAPQPDAKITGSIQVINEGNLPALNLAIGLNIEARTSEPTSFGAPLPARNEADLGPKIDDPPIPITSSEILTKSNWMAFQSGTKQIYVCGMIR